MSHPDTVTRKCEVSVHAAARFRDTCARHGCEAQRTYCNGGVTYGFRVTGPRAAVTRLIKIFAYPS